LSDRDAGGCLLVVLVLLALWGVAEIAHWLGEGFNMTLFGALLAILLLAGLWSIPGGVVQPDAVAGGAVIARTAAAKPVGLLLALAALYAGPSR
jgi:hypothetical protein